MLNRSLQTKIAHTISSLSYIFENDRQRHFTLVYKRRKLLVIGVNYKDETHPLAKKFNFWDDKIHSELDAIRQFKDKNGLSELIFVNVRVNRVGDFLMAKPCKNCQELLRVFGIRRIYYSDKEGFNVYNCS